MNPSMPSRFIPVEENLPEPWPAGAVLMPYPGPPQGPTGHKPRPQGLSYPDWLRNLAHHRADRNR